MRSAFRREHGRRTRPWIPEPDLWMQWDYFGRITRASYLKGRIESREEEGVVVAGEVRGPVVDGPVLGALADLLHPDLIELGRSPPSGKSVLVDINFTFLPL